MRNRLCYRLLPNWLLQTTAVIDSGSEKRRDVLNKVLKIGALAAKVAINAGVGPGAGDAVNYLLENEKSFIGDLRVDLQKVINNVKEKTNKCFLFFIDDLDRIDPPVAVELLELLKNIFTLDNCVFILAIDYDVVVKGLKPKFGELTDKNEREFRSFFDKIIQVPFSMPVESYKIDGFLKQELLNIAYLNKQDAQSKILIPDLAEVTQLTVGTNPRAIKRLLNSLSLIKCINDAKSEKLGNDEDFKLTGELDLYVNYVLVSIQIAYPKVYGLLNAYPDFSKWDEETAIQLNLNGLETEIKERLDQIEKFGEEWEQVLYRLCETDYFLKQRALNISELLNQVKEKLIPHHSVGEYVKRIIRLSAITNVETANNQPVNYHSSSFLKTVRDHLIKALENKMPQMKKTITSIGERVQSKARFSMGEELDFNLSSSSANGNIWLKIEHNFWICSRDYRDIATFFEEKKQTETLRKIESEYNELSHKYSRKSFECYDSHELMKDTFLRNGRWYFNLRFYVILPKVDEFIRSEFLDSMAEIVEGIYNTCEKLKPYRE